jgi:hypothetical protein
MCNTGKNYKIKTRCIIMGFITDLELQMEIEAEEFAKLPAEEQERITKERKAESERRKARIKARQEAKKND